MDLSLTYLCIGGGGSSSACFPSSHPPWMLTRAPLLKELPLVGQLSLPPVLDNVHPFLLHDPGPACQTDDHMNTESDHPAEAYGTTCFSDITRELPLLWPPQEQAQDQQMDCSIWSRLPLDVIERVIAFLHVPDAVRFCVVSKRWNLITSSANFRKVFSESYNGGSSLLMFLCDQGSRKDQTPWLAAYDLHAKRWYSMTLSFLPTPPMAPFMNYTVVSASGGLLCLWPEPAKSLKSVGFIVCNPVTRRWKELPCRSHDNRMPDLVILSMDNGNCHYKLLVLTETPSDSQIVVATELYDSWSCKWKHTGFKSLSGGKFKSTAVSKGKVYLVHEERNQRYKIRVYDMEENVWRSSLSMPAIFYDTPEVIGTPVVLDCNGNLLLVGRVGKHSSKDEVVIWELDLSVNGIDSWREVDRMPQDIAREFLGCLVFGHYYCISDSDQIFFIASFKAPMLVYSLKKKAWSWWSWPFFEKYGSRFPIFGFVKVPAAFPPFGFAFDLRFDSLV